MLIRLDDAERDGDGGYRQERTTRRTSSRPARPYGSRRMWPATPRAGARILSRTRWRRARIERSFRLGYKLLWLDLSIDPASGVGAKVDWQFPGATRLSDLIRPAEASGGTGMSVEIGDRPTGTLRTMETGLSARLRRDTRDLWCQNHEPRRSDESQRVQRAQAARDPIKAWLKRLFPQPVRRIASCDNMYSRGGKTGDRICLRSATNQRNHLRVDNYVVAEYGGLRHRQPELLGQYKSAYSRSAGILKPDS